MNFDLLTMNRAKFMTVLLSFSVCAHPYLSTTLSTLSMDCVKVNGKFELLLCHELQFVSPLVSIPINEVWLETHTVMLNVPVTKQVNCLVAVLESKRTEA